MAFGISRRARSKKAKAGLRALLGGKAPEAKDVGDRLSRLARRMLGDAVVDANARRLTLQLHPEASPVRIVVLPDGDLEITGETANVGPGYHAWISVALAPVLAELDYVWDADEPDPRTAMTAWLAAQLAAGETRIAIPAELVFITDAAVLTPMGPRDAAWRDAVIADPLHGRDAFAWWDIDGKPGHAELAAAMIAMWLRVPWREPLDDDERDLMRSVDGALRAARKLDPALPFPYAAWADIMEHLGVSSDRIAAARARATGPAVIGYRRFPVEGIVDAWRFVQPGAFVGNFEDERYWATDGDRLLELRTLTTGGEQSSRALVDIAPPAHPVIETSDDGARCARAERFLDGDIHVVHGVVAVTPEVALLTCKSKDPDMTWALDVWRSLTAS